MSAISFCNYFVEIKLQKLECAFQDQASFPTPEAEQQTSWAASLQPHWRSYVLFCLCWMQCMVPKAFHFFSLQSFFLGEGKKIAFNRCSLQRTACWMSSWAQIHWRCLFRAVCNCGPKLEIWTYVISPFLLS